MGEAKKLILQNVLFCFLMLSLTWSLGSTTAIIGLEIREAMKVPPSHFSINHPLIMSRAKLKKKKNSAFLKHNELDLHIAPTFLHLSKITHYPLKSSSNEPFLIPLFLTHHLSISNPPACPLTVLKYGLIHQFLVITEAVQATPSLA